MRRSFPGAVCWVKKGDWIEKKGCIGKGLDRGKGTGSRKGDWMEDMELDRGKGIRSSKGDWVEMSAHGEDSGPCVDKAPCC